MLQFSTIHVGHTVMEIVVIKVWVTHVFLIFTYSCWLHLPWKVDLVNIHYNHVLHFHLFLLVMLSGRGGMINVWDNHASFTSKNFLLVVLSWKVGLMTTDLVVHHSLWMLDGKWKNTYNVGSHVQFKHWTDANRRAGNYSTCLRAALCTYSTGSVYSFS